MAKDGPFQARLTAVCLQCSGTTKQVYRQIKNEEKVGGRLLLQSQDSQTVS